MPPAPLGPPPRRRTGLAVAGALGAVGVATAVVIGVSTAGGTTVVGVGSPADLGSGSQGPSSGGSPFGSGPTGSDTSSTTGLATEDQQIGVVDIDTVLGFRNGEAAGTGMVLSSDGEILTNNHVVQGATKISVTVVSTGNTYAATVVGTDPSDDVAVLQLSNASGLQVADFSDATAAVGEAVTAVGNAGGSGGTPSAVSGTVTALDQSITATDETGGNPEQLTGLIETDADVQAGDSGGPLYDTASGEIIGMDTAASTGGQVDGYAIPISSALSIAGQIVDGVDNSTIHQGYPGFLGVSVTSAAGTDGAAIAGVVSGGPAESAGILAGDVITAVGRTAIASADDLTGLLAGYDPGDSVPVTWTDGAGASHTAQVTLATGPAD
nr:trypsin-like peptidase domain-containing protein [Petropleomorpha daqingensis]